MGEHDNIRKVLDAFFDLKVFVIGDVMVDEYLNGKATRISPEAPVPVVNLDERELRLGGAANVAFNLRELGASPTIFSVIGDDAYGHMLKELMQDAHINHQFVIPDKDRKTTVKTRIYSGQQQLLRYDNESTHSIDNEMELSMLDNIIDRLYEGKPNVVIFQDYNKGFLTKKLIANVIYNCKKLNIPTIVDPKKDNFFEYKGCTAFKPNLKEISTALEMDIKSDDALGLVEADNKLREVLEHTYSIITLSENGMYVSSPNKRDHIEAYPKTIVDVCGAGDTVVSILALGMALKLDIVATAELANLAASIVCESVGVVPVNRERLLMESLRVMTS